MDRLRLPLPLTGAGLLWGWGFLYFLLNRGPSESPEGIPVDLLYLGFVLISSIIAVVFSARLESTRSLRGIALAGCALMAGGMVTVAVPDAVVGVAGRVSLGNGLAGAGLGLFWIAWGIALSRFDVEEVESAFLSWLPVLAGVVGLSTLARMPGAPTFAFTLLMVLLPAGSFAFFWRATALTISEGAEGGSGDVGLQADGSAGLRAAPASGTEAYRVFALMACLFCAISFMWNDFLSSGMLAQDAVFPLFAVGVLVALVVLWAALRVTRRFSLATLCQWALPVAVAAVALSQIFSGTLAAGACLGLTVVMVGFEMMSKLLAVHVAKRLAAQTARIVSVGFAAAALGGFVGGVAWWLVESAGGAISPQDVMLVALFIFAVCASVSIGRYTVGRAVPVAAGQEAPATQNADNEAPVTPWVAVAEKYGLSPRERDVFELLVQGRSRTYIREMLFISRGTVDTHIQHIYGKMGINSKEELMRIVHDNA